MTKIFLTAALTLPFATAVMAAGGGSETAPSKPKCEEGQVYDKATKTCIDAQKDALDTQGFYENVRELAYAGRYEEAERVLSFMPQDDDRTLTYLGFVNRKQGRTDAAMAHYERALAVNPANVLARSYMGQGFVEAGDLQAAMAQLKEIRAHGGTGTWAEASLRTAIATGKSYDY
jgi:tetratricopeptide (TPR) repeat protein